MTDARTDGLDAAGVAVSAAEALDNIQAWVMQRRIELLPLDDPDFHAKHDTLKAVGAKIRSEKATIATRRSALVDVPAGETRKPLDAECYGKIADLEARISLLKDEYASCNAKRNAAEAAADEIARLRGREEEYRKALEQIADDYKTYKGHGDYDEDAMDGREAQKIARDALTAAPEKRK